MMCVCVCVCERECLYKSGVNAGLNLLNIYSFSFFLSADVVVVGGGFVFSYYFFVIHSIICHLFSLLRWNSKCSIWVLGFGFPLELFHWHFLWRYLVLDLAMAMALTVVSF